MDFNNIFNDTIKEYLGIIREQKKLSTYNYLNLVALLLTKAIITRKDITETDVNYFLNLIINSPQNKIVNDNTPIFKEAVSYSVKAYFDQEGINEKSYEVIMNNWFNGYMYHTLNACYANWINEHGLKIASKPWDMEEIRGIMRLFDHSVFGLFNGENEGIFFAPNLSVSPYYGLTSPTFFRKFVENDRKYLNVFLDRNLPLAYESIEALCKKNNLRKEECETVLAFFKKNWLVFASDELPSIVIKQRPHTTIPAYPNDNVLEFVINEFMSDIRNTYYKQDIPRDEITIFSYDKLGLVQSYQKTN